MKNEYCKLLLLMQDDTKNVYCKLLLQLQDYIKNAYCKLLLLQSVAVTAKRCQICTFETTHEILRNILNPNATLTVFPAFRPSVRRKNRDCYSVAIFSLFTFTFSVLIIQNSDYSDFKLQRETLS